MSRSARIQLIVFAIVLALLATPFLVPVNTYRDAIEMAASHALNRDVQIRGPLHLSLYPDIGLKLSDVSIGNLPGAPNPEMIRAGTVVVGAKLEPLLSGRLEVTELTLEKPVIRLETGKNGETNWRFAREPKSGAPADAAALNRIGFSHLNIRDGEIDYANAQTGKQAVLKNVSLSLDMPDVAMPTLALPLSFDGSLAYNGEKLNVDGRLDNFGALLNGRSTGARLSIGSNIINADFMGMIGSGGISGALKMGAHSVRSFAAWLGHPMPPGNGFGLVALEGAFASRDGVYTLSHAHLAFDSMNLNGDFTFDTNPATLTLKARGNIDRLDLNPYLAPGASDDTVTAAKAKAQNPEAPLSLGGLKTVNADVTLVVGGLVLPNLKLDQAVVKASLNNGVLKADLSDITCYGGNGKAMLTVDTSGAEPVFHHRLEVNGLKVRPFLADIMGVKRIAGTGAVRLEISSHGATEQEIVKNLDGKGEIHFADGAISGADLAAVARLVQTVLTGELPPDAAGNAAETPLRSASASFAIENGVLRSNDVQLLNPTLEIDGRGGADLASHMLDFHFAPKLHPPLDGGSKREALRGGDLGVPFFVKGLWERPRYGAELGGLTKTLVNGLQSGNLSLKSILGTQKQTDH